MFWPPLVLHHNLAAKELANPDQAPAAPQKNQAAKFQNHPKDLVFEAEAAQLAGVGKTSHLLAALGAALAPAAESLCRGLASLATEFLPALWPSISIP